MPPPGDRSAHFRARWGDDPSWLGFGGISGKRTYVNINFHYAKVLTLKTEERERERECLGLTTLMAFRALRDPFSERRIFRSLGAKIKKINFHRPEVGVGL